MQRAARKVALENKRLRDLLARYGVMPEEIDTYLRSCEEAGENDGGEGTAKRRLVGTRGNNSRVFLPAIVASPGLGVAPYPSPVEHDGGGQVYVQQLGGLDPRGPQHHDKDLSMQRSNTLEIINPLVASLVSHPPVRNCLSSSISPSAVHLSTDHNIRTPEDTSCPTTPACFCPPTSKPPERPLSSGLEISCEAAATIIAHMRGDGDWDSAHASLGCIRGEGCTIKNSTIMQIMDEQ